MEIQARKHGRAAAQSSCPAHTGQLVIVLLDSDDDTPDAADPTHQLLDTSGVAVLGQDRHVPPVTQQPRIPQQPRVPFQRQHLCKPAVATQGAGAHTRPHTPMQAGHHMHPDQPATAPTGGAGSDAGWVVKQEPGQQDEGNDQVQVPAAEALLGPAMHQGTQQYAQVAADRAEHQGTQHHRQLAGDRADVQAIQSGGSSLCGLPTGSAPAVPDVNASRNPGGNWGHASGVRRAAAPGVVPEWENHSPQSTSLLVPMSSQTAGQISSVRLQLGGVLLHEDCTRCWTHTYRSSQQVLSIAMPRGSVALVEGAQLQPCTLLRCNVMPETFALVIHASWPLAPPGQPGGISHEMYGARVDGDAPTCTFGRGRLGGVFFRRSSLVSMQLTLPGQPASSVHIMAAFARDGVIIPLQQPVDIELGRLIGWPGRSHIAQDTTAVGCYRWLPVHADEAALQLQRPAGDACDNSDAGASANAHGTDRSVGGDGQGPLEFAPGLLVISLQSNNQASGTNDDVQTAHQQPLAPPALPSGQAVGNQACAGGAEQSNTGQPQLQQQQPTHQHPPVVPSPTSRLQLPPAPPPALNPAPQAPGPSGSHKRPAPASRDPRLVNRPCITDRVGAEADTQEPCTDNEQHHHQGTGCEAQHHAEADTQLHGQGIDDEHQADPAQPLKRARLSADSGAAVHRITTCVEQAEDGSPGQNAPAASPAGPSRDVGMDSRQSPASQLEHWPPAPHVQPAPAPTPLPVSNRIRVLDLSGPAPRPPPASAPPAEPAAEVSGVRVASVASSERSPSSLRHQPSLPPPDPAATQVPHAAPVMAAPAPTAAAAPAGAPSLPRTTPGSPAAPAQAPASLITRPLPQLPDFCSHDKVDSWKVRHAQLAVLMQLGRAVRPQSLDEMASRLQDIKAEALWGMMAQYYQPMQQLQVVGGSDAGVRALAHKLLNMILA